MGTGAGRTGTHGTGTARHGAARVGRGAVDGRGASDGRAEVGERAEVGGPGCVVGGRESRVRSGRAGWVRAEWGGRQGGAGALSGGAGAPGRRGVRGGRAHAGRGGVRTVGGGPTCTVVRAVVRVGRGGCERGRAVAGRARRCPGCPGRLPAAPGRSGRSACRRGVWPFALVARSAGPSGPRTRTGPARRRTRSCTRPSYRRLPRPSRRGWGCPRRIWGTGPHVPGAGLWELRSRD